MVTWVPTPTATMCTAATSPHLTYTTNDDDDDDGNDDDDDDDDDGCDEHTNTSPMPNAIRYDNEQVNTSMEC